MKHCPSCNASSSERRFFGEFCERCAAETLSKKLAGSVSMTVCRDCGNVRVAGVFVPFDASSIKQLLKSVYKGYGVELLHLGDSKLLVRVSDESGLGVNKEIDIEYNPTLCDSCSRRRGGYYEGIVQFRGDAQKVSSLADALGRFLVRKGGFVTRVVEKENGVDVYVSDKKLALGFISAKRLKYQSSYELHGQKRGKKLYRNTYSVSV